MNYKGFKKIRADHNYTTFKHESNGSELKVAHKGLTPKMKAQVDSLPVHLADGDPDGQIPDALKANDDSSSSGHAPISININSAPQPSPTAVPTSVDPTPQSSPQMKDENGGVQSQDAQPGLASDASKAIMQGLAKIGSFGVKNADNAGGPQQPQQASMPSTPAGQMAGDGALPPPDPNAAPPDQGATTQPPVAAAAPAPQPTYQQQKHQEMAQEMTSFQHDLDQGFITPKTYQDLFHDKSTLGKIGTIFGLMLSGAGSGLSHQSNALMDMMNKQISNDLDAQKSSASNRMNFHQLANQSVLQQAQANHLNTENMIQAQSYKFMMAQRVAVHDLAQRVAAMPEGSPQKQQGQLALASMSQAMNNGQFNMMDVASAGMARINQMLGQNGQGGETAMSPAIQLRRQQALGYITPEQYKEGIKEVGNIDNHSQINKNAVDSFDKIAKLTTIAGRASNPIQYKKQIDAEWNPMMDKLTKDTEGRVTPITLDMMGALKPSLTDNADTLRIKRDKLGSILTSGLATPTLDSLGVRMDKGLSSAPRGTSQGKYADGATASDSKGNKIVFQGGHWLPASNQASK
jgi:hypothetical protein